jgi:hypothetical protein
MNRRPWKRLAALRAARRRGTELLSPPEEARLEPMPPLEPPDDDREFLTPPTTGTALRLEAA